MYHEQFSFLGYLLLYMTVFGAVFIVLSDVAIQNLRLAPTLALCTAMFLLGLIGYLAFWVAFWHYPTLRFAKVLFFAWVAARLIYMVSRQHLVPLLAWLGEPLLFVFLFFLAVEGIGFANGGGSTQTRRRKIVSRIFCLPITSYHSYLHPAFACRAFRRRCLQTGFRAIAHRYKRAYIYFFIYEIVR